MIPIGSPPPQQLMEERQGKYESFPCDANPLCLIFDLLTCFHRCTGCIFWSVRPTVYDKRCPHLLPSYWVDREGGVFRCCLYPSRKFREEAVRKKQDQELSLLPRRALSPIPE